MNNDENELDLTTFVPPIHRKPPMGKSSSSDLESPVRNKLTLNEKRKFSYKILFLFLYVFFLKKIKKKLQMDRK